MKMNVKVSNVIEVEANIDDKKFSLKKTEAGNYTMYSERTSGYIVLSAKEMEAVVEQLYPAVQQILELEKNDKST